MGQQLQDGINLQYSSFYFFKGKAGVGWEMKVSKFGQVLPFPNGLELLKVRVYSRTFVRILTILFSWKTSEVCYHGQVVSCFTA